MSFTDVVRQGKLQSWFATLTGGGRQACTAYMVYYPLSVKRFFLFSPLALSK